MVACHRRLALSMSPPPRMLRNGKSSQSQTQSRAAQCFNVGRMKQKLQIHGSSLGKTGKSSVVIPTPDYRIALTLLGTATLLSSQQKYGLALPIGILGAFLGVQTSRVRFKFDDKALEVVIGEEQADSGENAFVGGENKWAYSSFVNWEFWWKDFPVLVYFKETQTKDEGQIHFFPILFNGKELYDVMTERCGKSTGSKND